MKLLTIEHILQLHVLAIKQFGGSEGLRDLGRLESAAAVQTQSVFGEELYPEIHDKAAAMCRGIIGDHPFTDGNKRTAILAAITFIEINGLQFSANEGELEDFAVQIATDHLDVPAISQWLKQHTTQA